MKPISFTEGQAVEEITGIGYQIGAWVAAGMVDSMNGFQAIMTLTPTGDTPYRTAILDAFSKGEKHWEQFGGVENNGLKA